MAKCRVLIVDDEPAFLTGLWSLFADSYNLFSATSAEIALQILAREKIDVIVTDYRMPGMNGLQLLVETKKRFPGIVRVLMTAYADMELVVRALNEGEIQRFVSKPYRAQEIMKVFAECRDLAAAASGDHAGPRGKAVLVAHDSAIATMALRRLLCTTYDVLTTANGVEAMNLLATRKIDALVLGVGLELLDGCSIATYLKKERRLATPIVFLSSGTGGSYGEYLGECGADLVLDQGDPESLPRLQEFLASRLN